MSSRLFAALAGAVMAVALMAAPAAAGYDAPNQGADKFVFKVDNKDVWCKDPVPGPKVEGDFGQKIFIKSHRPIDKVTIKSGKGAYEVWSAFWKHDGKYFAKIKISKDVSNYVVWTCKKKDC